MYSLFGIRNLSRAGLQALCLLALSCTVAGKNACADPIGYNFVDVAYEHTFFDQSGINDGNGVIAGLSYYTIENFFLETSYSFERASIEFEDLRTDIENFKYGVGGYYPICEDFHLLGRIGGEHISLRIKDNGHAQDDAVYLGTGIKAKVAESVEVDLNVTFTDGNSDNSWDYGLLGIVSVADQVALTGGVSIDDDSNTDLTAGVRLTF